MEFNPENLHGLVENAYIGHATEAFGEPGGAALRLLLNAVINIYRECPPEGLSGHLTVVADTIATPTAPKVASVGSTTRLSTVADVGKRLVSLTPGSHALVEVAKDNTFHVVSNDIDFDFASLADTAVVYRYEDQTDRILAGPFDDFVRKVFPLLSSSFAVPTKSSLEDVLEYYRSFALHSRCQILGEVWEGGVNGPRLVLRNRPERIMRNSLCQAIAMLLRDANARPEHNTDETKPVDIKVDWTGTSASALIEVKWMGRSTARPGSKSPYTDYGPERANEGASQLDDYLEREVRHSKTAMTLGYLIVFDARRRNIQGPADPLSREDALHFQNDEIVYSPDYAALRDDIQPPVRYFLMPRESDFLTN